MEQKTALVVVSYGVSRPSALPPLTAIAHQVGQAFPNLPLIHAFTSRFLRDALAKGGGPDIPHVSQALDQLAGEGYTQVLLQPTHLLPGGEYQAMADQLEGYASRLSFSVGSPLLHTPQDVEAVAAALPACLSPLEENEGALFLGHGTSHEAHGVYAQLEQALHRQGHTNLYVGTLTGGLTPPQTAQRLHHLSRLYVHPLTVVCGVHAMRDMLEGTESWCGQLRQAGMHVEGIPQGLGDCAAIRRLFVSHAQQAARTFLPIYRNEARP